MAQVSSGLPKTTDPSLPTAGRDALTEVAGPIKRLEGNPQIEYAEPTSTTKVNPIYATSIVNRAREYPIAGMTGVHPLTRPSLCLADSLNPSPPVRPPRASVDQASSNLATEVQDDPYPLEQVMGSTLSPDEQVQEGVKLAGQKDPDSFVVPVVPIIATLGQHEHPANTNPQLNHPVSSNTMAPPDHVHPDVEWSTRTSRTSSIQQTAKGLTNVALVNGGREMGASGASPTPSKSTSSPDRMKPNASSVLHSAYPVSEGEGLDKLSTRAVGGDTSVTSLSTSVGNGDSENNSSRKGVTSIEHSPRPIFSAEHGRALGTQRGAIAGGAIAGGATAAVVAAKERDEREGTRFQHTSSPGITKSSHFSGTRKLTKSTRRSLSGGRTEDPSTGPALTDVPTGAAFPESTYVNNTEDGIGAAQDLSKDPLLAPLPVSKGDTGIVEPTTTPALAARSPEHKHNRLIKKTSPTADAPLRVADSPIHPSPDNVGTSTGLRADVDTKGTHAYKAPRGAPETGHPIHPNEYTSKPKLMDRIKGEVKIMQGTLKGDEGKKLEGRMLKEFGSC